ncbi:hypothetical protein P7C70_g4092, partial [Phenoliferia sp. Uapishka_3]
MYSDIWTLSGSSVRMAVFLGLNHLTQPNSFLKTSADGEQEYERRTLFWWAFSGNCFASSNTGWVMSIQPGKLLFAHDGVITSLHGWDAVQDDLTTLLPPKTFGPELSTANPPEDREREWRALSSWSPEFYSFHPAQYVGGLQMFFKSMLLLGRSAVFPTSKLHTSPTFVKLSNDINAFLISTSSSSFEEPTSQYRPLIEAVPHLCRILIHEQLCSNKVDDWHLMVCLDAARKILCTVKSAEASGAAGSEWLPWINHCWSVAGRTFIRALAVKEAWCDSQGTLELRSHVSVIIDATDSYHTLHSDNVVMVLQQLLSNPSVSLCFLSPDEKSRADHHGILKVCLPRLNSAAPTLDQALHTDADAESLSATSASLALLLAEQQATMGHMNHIL